MDAVLAVLFLVFLEGMLSFDNALALAALVRKLPVHQQKKALTYGMIGAFAFRGLALFFLSFIMANLWIKILGGAYLVYLGAAHFLAKNETEKEFKAYESFWKVILIVELTDIAFSIDSILAAVAVSSNYYVVLCGGILGIIMMRFASTVFIKLMDKYSRLEDTAFYLVSIIGIKLLLEAYGLDFEHGVMWFSLWGLMLATLAYGFSKKTEGVKDV